MAGPIYKLWMFRPKEAWYQLSQEERDKNTNRIMEDIEKVGGKSLLMCSPTWSTERWLAFGIEEYPDIEAVQKFTDMLLERDHFRYIESVSMLGTKWPPS
jgi:hemerythrin superfamily protein